MKNLNNPFIYGSRVSGSAFWNREKEIEELLEDIRCHQHVIIFENLLKRDSMRHR